MPDHDPAGKAALRRRLLAARRTLDPAGEREAAAGLDTQVMALAGPDPRTVCAYVSTQGEPPTGRLLEHLARTGHRVLLPVLLPDLDLDWAAWEPGTSLLPRRFGLLEPSGPRLGSAAVASAGMVVCPGLAGSPAGARLGRGGGSYDRVLSRTTDTVLRVLLLHDAEVRDDVPTDPHDQPVDVLVTPRRTVWCRP
ncbi:MAG: 5-formyltetrahydrofolate cyclo-ligase [Actinomycetota bacterium]|nr:5-formyltetrahydrofolate cyclo-ligase [Actinomycetota bacterium]